jgi:hypothetical protein
MTAKTSFCGDCGAVVGDGWESCSACAAPQTVDATTARQPARVTPPAGKIGFWAKTFRDLGVDSSDPSVAAYLYVIGGTCLLAAFIYFLATAGFPPHTTTTFEYGANGSVTESTSPGTLEFLVCVALFVVGGILVRAGKAASAESRK